jgi:hypothetical protein
MRSPLTPHAKRRLYWLSLASATAFLFAILLYDLLDIGLATDGWYMPCSILMFGGCILCFKALETWSFPDDYAGKDTDEEQAFSKYYAIPFYFVGGALTLVAGFLLVWAVVRNVPTTQETAIITFALLVASSCILIGHHSAG